MARTGVEGNGGGQLQLRQPAANTATEQIRRHTRILSPLSHGDKRIVPYRDRVRWTITFRAAPPCTPTRIGKVSASSSRASKKNENNSPGSPFSECKLQLPPPSVRDTRLFRWSIALLAHPTKRILLTAASFGYTSTEGLRLEHHDPQSCPGGKRQPYS